MGFVLVLVIGGVIGWLAALLTGTSRRTGPLADVVIGVLGSLLGLVLAHALPLGPLGPLAVYLAAVTGSVLLILLLRVTGALRGPNRSP